MNLQAREPLPPACAPPAQAGWRLAAGRAADIFKLRIGVLMTVTALAGYVVTPGSVLAGWELAALLAAVLGASAAAGAFNQYVEVDLDARMARTRRRAFVTGDVPRRPAWLGLIGVLLAVSVGGAGWLFNGMVAACLLLGAVFYGVVYTLWLKRRTPVNIVIGGASGSFAVLAGAAATDPALGGEAWALALVLFLWTPSHFWSLAIGLKDDYANAGVPMLPVVVGDDAAARVILVNTVLIAAASFAPPLAALGPIYLAGATIAAAHFLARCMALVRSPSRASAMRAFVGSLTYLTVLLIAAMLAVAWSAAGTG